jgi:hypothetical protein
MSPVDARKAPVVLDTKDDPRRAEYRKQHQVRLVESAQEGTGVDLQPNGTYGFTYAPAASAPMFASRKYQNFEIHKSPQGAKFVLGYVTAAEVADIAKKNPIDIKLYPDAFQESTEMVCLDLADLHPRSQNSGQPGSPVPLRYEP